MSYFVIVASAATAGTPQNAWCWPITAQLTGPVQTGDLRRRVALFVEEENQCGPDGVPGRTSDLPDDLEGRALIEWVLDDAARATGKPRYHLWSRGDVWLVAPPDGAHVLDTWVSVDASTAATTSAAFTSLNPQIQDVMRVHSTFANGEGLLEARHGEVVDPPNDLTVAAPLLEVLRALHRPHERGLVGYFVQPGRSVTGLSHVGGGVPGERWRVPHSLGEIRGAPVQVWRNPVDGELRQGTRAPAASWQRADDVVTVHPNGERMWLEDRGPAALPVPSADERPPAYPFALTPERR